jgi:hypothetical protein
MGVIARSPPEADDEATHLNHNLFFLRGLLRYARNDSLVLRHEYFGEERSLRASHR